MTECPIFEILDAAETLWAEIARLTGSVSEAFAAQGIVATYKTDESMNDEASGRYGCHYQVQVPVSRQRRPRHFLLTFDMWRPPTERPWIHSRTALVTFAYSPVYESGWDLEQVLLSGAGGLAADWAKAEGRLHADGRLIEWGEASTPWHTREWLFSVPMVELNGPDAFDRYIVAPVTALLMKNAEPDLALQGTPAIRIAI